MRPGIGHFRGTPGRDWPGRRGTIIARIGAMSGGGARARGEKERVRRARAAVKRALWAPRVEDAA